MTKYDSIKEYLTRQARICQPQGRRMPTVRELMRKFDASQAPVTRAIRDLKEAGLIDCRQGMGIIPTGKVKLHERFNSLLANGSADKILFITVDFFAENLWLKEHTLNIYAQQSNVDLIMCRTQQNTDWCALISEISAKHSLRGVVLISASDRLTDEELRFLGKLDFPVILQDNSFYYAGLPGNIASLVPDVRQMGCMAAEAFIRSGHKAVGFIRNEPESDANRQLLKGFTDTCKESGVRHFYFSDAMKSWENSMDASIRITRNSIAAVRREGISALFYNSMNGAFAGLGVLQAEGFRVPEEIAIIGGEDGVCGRYSYPALTAVASEQAQMSIDAIDMLLGKIKFEKSIKYPCQLIMRGSLK